MTSGRPLRVLYVWDADYPWDIRTHKICKALSDAGMDVVIAARNTRGEARVERLPEATVMRIPRLGGVGSWVDRQSSFPLFANPRWIAHVRRCAKAHRADLIMVRDLPLAPTALLVGRTLGTPVVLDMAENYPAMIRDVWTSGRARRTDAVVRNPALVSLVERLTVPRIDHTITVVAESSERLIAMGVPPSRLTIVSNTPSSVRAKVRRVLATSTSIKAVYLGLMEIPRGLLVLLDATASLRRRHIQIVVDLIGDGRDMTALRDHAAALGLDETTVRFHGRLPNHDALTLVAESEVGIVPHHAVESWNTTIPNKLFDYMAAGLAVVSSNAVPARRIVEETQCGLVFDWQNSESLASALEVMSDPELRQRFASAGQDAVAKKYNWESDTRALLRMVGDVAAIGAARNHGVTVQAPATVNPDTEQT